VSQRWACLLGHPVAHSLSPTLHNAAFAALGIDAHYFARDVATGHVAAAVDDLRVADCLGANVTAPHKQAVMQYLDFISAEALLLGAVNTIVNESSRLHGYNTDARGLARWLSLLGVRADNALVLGAGGAARATVWALAKLGARRVHVLNRTHARATKLVVELQPHLPQTELTFGELQEAAEPRKEQWAVIVNATSMGHHGQAPNVHPSCYSPGSVAIELAYNPPLTGFMQAAMAAGARAENGLGMLLHQAALACEHWTGQEPPIEVYERAVRGRVEV
jgi:shikimate dehydrogenase